MLAGGLARAQATALADQKKRQHASFAAFTDHTPSAALVRERKCLVSVQKKGVF